MRKLSMFMQTTLDGYFSGPNGDLSWAHSHDAEFQEFVAGNAQAGGALLFGRKTYELMARYWPTPQARESNPVVAKSMNDMPKVVFSRTLNEAAWSNTRLLGGGFTGDLPAEVRKLKQETGPDIAILGSGSIVTQLAAVGLIDEFQIVISPTVLGSGSTLFAGMRDKLSLTLTRSRTFGNGKIFLCYKPAA
jgi:dihydrofolate reductase